MSTVDTTALSVSSVAVGQTVGAYQFLMPRLAEVRQAGAEDVAMARDVYIGQVAAAALSIGVGMMLTVLTGSKLPVVVSVFVALIIGGMYHYALRSEP